MDLTKEIQMVTISFPEIRLHARDAHKLRGYFGNLFKEYSPLLHNHLEGGELRYGYPLVQYKVLNDVPTLLGLGEGAALMVQLFLEIKELDIDGKIYPVYAKNISAEDAVIGIGDKLHTYRFENLWMALNQENYERFKRYDDAEKQDQLNSIATRNILSFFKGFGLYLSQENRIFMEAQVYVQHETHFKNNKMTSFKGKLVTNAFLPNFIGLGKSVSRGFGVLRKIK
jgi:Cas6b C-terminal domain/Cas6b N-terminal domain